jgi:hypothetical protein
MFDTIKETISRLFGNSTGEANSAVNVPGDLQNPIIDPGLLIELSQTEILELLEQQGINPSQMGASQFSELIQSLGAGERFSDIAPGWFEGERR